MQADTDNPFGVPRVAVAAGDAALRKHLARDLVPFYQVAECGSMSEALAECRRQRPHIMLVSEKLPVSGGHDLVRMLRLDPQLAAIPVLMVVAKADRTTRERVTHCGAQGCLVATADSETLLTAVSTLVNRAVEAKWVRLSPVQCQALTNTLQLFNSISKVIGEGEPILYESVNAACAPLVQVVADGSFKDMLQGVRDHDNYSYAHSIRVATYLALFGAALNLSKDEQNLLACGGLLHDVGKVTIPLRVLNKPGRLNPDELMVMRGHVTASIAYLERCSDLPKGIITIAAQHHEKVDGSGYPFGVAGSQLNRLARIAAIVDVFTALTDRRVYKQPIEPETAFAMMIEEMASQLDVKLLLLFRQMLLDATPSRSARLA